MGNEHLKIDASAPDEAAPRESHADPAESVAQLFREHNEALVRFLLARLRSYQEAREVAQEAYVRLLSLDKPGAISYLRALLFKTAAGIAIDRLRRGQVDARAKASPLFSEFADMRTPERQALGEESVRRLERLLAAMPEKCRRAFMLHRFDGLDVSEIARELGLSTRMVRVYLARALLKCRTGLDLEPGLASGSRESERTGDPGGSKDE